MPSNAGLTIFIPVFNEESLMVRNVGELVRFLDRHGTPYEIILGSNGSTDGTVRQGKALSDRNHKIHFFHLDRKGVGTAFREGVKRAAFDRIITVDMDLSIRLDFIPEAFELLDRYDMVIGSKTTGTQKRPWIRKTASESFIVLAKLLLNINFHDYSIAAKGYRKKIVNKYLPFIDDKTFYVVELVYRACREKKRLIEVPVTCVDMRESRFNLIHEGCYKFGNLFLLWFSKTILRS